MPAVRSTQSASADHTRIASPTSDLAASAEGLQLQSATPAPADTFLGPAENPDPSLFERLAAIATEAFGAIAEFAQNIARPPARNPQSESAQVVDGTPQISGVKPPAKPFYIGLVDVPGVGFVNTMLSRNPAGEFDPTRRDSEVFIARKLEQPEASQVKSLTPAAVRLNVNPKDIILTYAKKVTAQRVRANYYRRELGAVTGHVIEHHWDELDVVSVNCVTGNFWVSGGLDYPRGEQAGWTGLNSASADTRTKSLAYRKLQAVMAMFRNNGCSWLTGSTTLRNQAEQQFFGLDYSVIVNPGSAFMLYDNIIWYGHFEDMTVTERGDTPHWFEFSIEFKVARTVDLNGVSEADVLETAGSITEFTEAATTAASPVSAQRSGVENMQRFLDQEQLRAEEEEFAAKVLSNDGVRSASPEKFEEARQFATQSSQAARQASDNVSRRGGT